MDVAPFHALRFRDPASLGALTAPPYDAIDPPLSRRLHARSPYNVVRLELDARRPDGGGDRGRYAAAARTCEEWRREGILALDHERAIYAYEQTYDRGAANRRQRGLLVALRLEPWEAGVVLPHEQVFPGPVEDRLRLLEALPVNVSPVYLLAEREPEAVTRLLTTVTRTPPLAAFTDVEEGVDHRLWRITDTRAHASVRSGLTRQRLLMADGHHRYTTALEYRTRHPPSRSGEGADRILAFVVVGDEPLVLASHRLVRRLPTDFEARLRGAGFDRIPLTGAGHDLSHRSGGDATPVAAVLAALDDPRGPSKRSPGRGPTSDRPNVPRAAFGLLTHEGGALLVVRDVDRVAELCATVPRPLRGIDVALLQRVLDVSLHLEDRPDQVVFTSDPTRAAEEVAAGRAAALFLVRPVPVTQVWAVAKAGHLLPPKSTSFFPKPRTGLVLRPLHP